jgi:hypothetical protein
MYRLRSFIIKVINDEDFTVSLDKKIDIYIFFHLSFIIKVTWMLNLTVEFNY